MEVKTVIILSQEEKQKIEEVIEKHGMQKLLDCFMGKDTKRKLMREDDELCCPRCGNRNVSAYGAMDHYCRVCGQAFDLK